MAHLRYPSRSGDDVAAEHLERAQSALRAMHIAYSPISLRGVECRLSRTTRGWHAVLCGTNGHGGSPVLAVREVIAIFSWGMTDMVWLDLLTNNGATPDQIRTLAEAISKALDILEDAP